MIGKQNNAHIYHSQVNVQRIDISPFTALIYSMIKGICKKDFTYFHHDLPNKLRYILSVQLSFFLLNILQIFALRGNILSNKGNMIKVMNTFSA